MEYFYRVPTSYAVNDYKEIMVRFVIDEHKGLSNRVFISIDYICDQCGYSSAGKNRNHNSFSTYVKEFLKYLISEGELIQCYGNDIDSARSDDGLGFYVQDIFYDSQPNVFAKLSDAAFHTIVDNVSEVTLSKQTLLKVYCYVRGHIIENKHNLYGYYKSVEVMCADLEIGNRKICDTALDFFVNHGLFKRYVTGSCYVNGKPKNVPNIYVLPDDRATDNINGLLQLLKERYKVDEFAPVLLPNVKRKTMTIKENQL